MKSDGTLSTYTGVKLRLASILETLLYFAHERKDEGRSRFIQELLGDLAADNFRLAVFGKYNRGKSTLMNALLGMNRLPTGILPLTSVVTTVRYDAEERVQIFREGWTFPQDIRMSELTAYVTEHGNPGNEKRVTLAQVFLPASILRYGFFLIDTPGVGSNIAANTKAAEGFIPRADAAIVVMSVESPLDAEDWALLDRVRSEVKRVFLVLNKTDLLPESERKSVTGIVSRRLEALYGNQVPVFPLSARNALAHAESGVTKQDDHELQALMEALLTFVKQEKTAQFLNRMAQRIQLLIQDERSLEYLAHREEAERQRLVRNVQTRADTALRVGKQELAALCDAIEKKSTLRPLLQSNQHVAWNSAGTEETARNTRHMRVRDLVPDYTPTMDRLSELVRTLEDAVPRELLFGDEATRQIGVAIGSSEVALHPAPWSTAERFWIKIGIASVPWLRRILLEPAWERHLDGLEHDVQQTLLHRIHLLEEEYVRLVTKIAGRVKSAASNPAQSNHTAALTKLSQELQEALDIAGEEQNPADSTKAHIDHEPPAPKAGCSLCEHLANIQFHFIRQYQYQLAADPDERARNAERGGLCAFHTWMYEAISSPQGVCMGYAPVPLHLAEEISARMKPNGNASGGLQDLARDLLQELRQCIVCDVIEAAESDKVKELVSNDNLLQTTPICLPHLCRIAFLDPPPAGAQALFEQMAAKLKWMGEDMQQFAMKQSGLRYRLTSIEERSAYINALLAMAGARPLSYIKTVVEI